MKIRSAIFLVLAVVFLGSCSVSNKGAKGLFSKDLTVNLMLPESDDENDVHYASESIVEKKIEESSNGIMQLDRFVPWTSAIFKSANEKAQDVLYVIFPSNRGGYNVQCVPDREGSFGFRKSIPESWKGNPAATGVNDCTFVHASGFIMGCRTLEAAISLAEKAVNNQEI